MAWGKQHTQTPPSTTRQLIPLVLTLVVLGVIAWVCYQIYLSLGKIQAQARKQMGDHVVFTKDGMRVNVQHVGAESYLDKTQSVFVKAWELGSSASGANEQEDAGKRKRHMLTRSKPGEGQS
ncbi:hypothetical protein N657DRAFT_644389 [Parathielavia appendiculata]|uniref:Uncharacterized protein n=1 Tax=Parathielavia appendiculata TaxID=2587402 RepID=A0AAN6U0J8_9PEZI|nr:hypothetical protein N657DRAFT_644389 [Parathielavia appendiculata]